MRARSYSRASTHQLLRSPLLFEDVVLEEALHFVLVVLDVSSLVETAGKQLQQSLYT